MTILKMDAAAVAVLFPEGSKERVELQTAVIAEFAKKSFSVRGALDRTTIESIVTNSLEKYNQSLKTGIAAAAHKIQVETLKDSGRVVETESGSYWDKVKTVKLNPLMEAEIRGITEKSFSIQVKAVIEEHISKLVQGTLTNNPMLQKLIQTKIEETVNSEILQKVQAALKTKDN